MKKFLKELLYDDKGNPDEHVLGMATGWFLLASLQIYSLYKGQNFDAQSFGLAFGAIGACGGVGKYMADK